VDSPLRREAHSGFGERSRNGPGAIQAPGPSLLSEPAPLDGFPCGPVGGYLGITTGREEGALPCPAYAGSSSARAALRYAEELARSHNATLIPVLAWVPPGAGDLGNSPVSIAEIPHLIERSASRLC
jgi:hypothetical protein